MMQGGQYVAIVERPPREWRNHTGRSRLSWRARLQSGQASTSSRRSSGTSADAAARASVVAVLVIAQKLLPAKAVVDVPLALAIVGLGLLIVVAPSSVPGLAPPM
jgi:hypothetical protein